MKKIFSALLLLSFSMFINAQVFNSGTNLRGKVFSIGLEPTLYGSKNLKLFVHGDLKIVPGTNLYFTGGLGNNEYLGGGIKWSLAKVLSLNTGVHHYNDVIGLDGSAILSIPVSNIHIVTGIDSNIELYKNKPKIPLWLPVGLEAKISTALSLMLEGEIKLNDDAFNIFGGGIIVFI